MDNLRSWRILLKKNDQSDAQRKTPPATKRVPVRIPEHNTKLFIGEIYETPRISYSGRLKNSQKTCIMSTDIPIHISIQIFFFKLFFRLDSTD